MDIKQGSCGKWTLLLDKYESDQLIEHRFYIILWLYNICLSDIDYRYMCMKHTDGEITENQCTSKLICHRHDESVPKIQHAANYLFLIIICGTVGILAAQLGGYFRSLAPPKSKLAP